MRSKLEDILDNRENKVSDFLLDCLKQTDLFRVVTGYFSLGGFAPLKDVLLRQDLEVRFLYGRPSKQDGGEKPLLFAIAEEGLVCTDKGILAQAPLAKDCARWISRKNVHVKTLHQGKLLHGKMFLASRGQKLHAVVGSSNFTKRGLGVPPATNIELNVRIRDSQMQKTLADWFDNIWGNDSLVKDAEEELLSELERCYREYSPEHIYYKTLYELFKDEIEKRRELDENFAVQRLADTNVWQALYEFQRDGAKSALAKITAYNGCILADSVGLGKTYTALAVIKYYELRNKSVLVLCPSRLKQNWTQFLQTNANGPFVEDRFNFEIRTHSELYKKRGMLGDTPVDQFNWGMFDLIVVDESHNFRNESKKKLVDGKHVPVGQYEKLMDVIKSGGKTNLLMLSATPVNTSFLDFGNQVKLITERDKSAFTHSLKIANSDQVVLQAHKTFLRWSRTSPEDKKALLDNLDASFLDLLQNLTIARSRQQIIELYKNDYKQIGGFPKRNDPCNKENDIDMNKEIQYENVIEQIMKIEYLIHRPSDYIANRDLLAALKKEQGESNFNQATQERNIGRLLLTNLLKRLESSVASLQISLEDTIQKIQNQIDQIQSHLEGDADSEVTDRLMDLSDGDSLEEELMEAGIELENDFTVSYGKAKYKLEDLDAARWQRDLIKEKEQIERLRELVAQIGPARDAKIHDLFEIIEDKAQSSQNRKILVFTSYIGTAKYLYKTIKSRYEYNDISIGLVTGDDEESTLANVSKFEKILDHFAPEARGKQTRVAGREIDILIATDCISEGQNLHDCDTVLNYDIHWNPVKLIQRLGRIDRIGSHNARITMHNFWPMKDLDAYLKLEGRVKSRMHIVGLAGGNEDVLKQEKQELDKRFRDSQMRQIKEEGKIMDLEEASGTLNMSELTWDYFVGQLINYLEKNKKELEDTPDGAYAVTDTRGIKAGEEVLDKSVIFFLRNKKPENRHGQNPIHPHYLLLVNKEGVQLGYSRARNILGIYDKLCVGKEKPLKDACAAFITDINNPKEFHSYRDLLERTIADIFNQAKKPGLDWGGADPHTLLRAAEELELVTWLVIASGKNQLS